MASLLLRGADRPRSERLKGLLNSTRQLGLVQLVLPALQSQPKPSSIKNVIPVILSDVDSKFSTEVKLMIELKQFHPNIKVPKILEKKSKSFLIIGDTPRDVAILQSENKMKACLGQNVKISLPKAYQTSKPKKSLVIKGVPTEVSEQEFKEFLDLNKINYAKAE